MQNPVVQPGALRLYTNPHDLIGCGIEIGEALAGIGSKYYHVGIALPNNQELAALSQGVVIGPMFQAECDIYQIDAPADKIAYALAWVQQNDVGKSYADGDLGWLWLLRRLRLRGAPWPDSQRICSWVGADFVRKTGVDPWPGLLSCIIAPGDFDGANGLTNIGRWTPVVPARA